MTTTMSAARILEADLRQPLEVLDDCRVLAALGHGGMAEVFLAARPKPGGDEILVLKRLHPHLDDGAACVGMFQDEARVALRLVHPNVVRCHQLGIFQGRHALLMEFLEGQPLQKLLARATELERKLPCEVVASLMAEVLEGLHYAHEAVGDDGKPLGIVHRDVSPHNLFLTSSGHIKVLDFGIAKTALQESRTRTGLLKGKVAYMAPEQARGEALDRRADVWSAGVVLWEALAGRRLFKAENEVASLNQTLTGKVPPLSSVRPEVPADLQRIVVRALQRDPAQRFPTAGAMALELRAWARSRRLPATNPARALMIELFGKEIAEQRRGIRAMLAQADAAPVSGSMPIPSLAQVAQLASRAGQTHGATITEHVDMLERHGRKTVRMLVALLAAVTFVVAMLGYIVLTRLPAPEAERPNPRRPDERAAAAAAAIPDAAPVAPVPVPARAAAERAETALPSLQHKASPRESALKERTREQRERESPPAENHRRERSSERRPATAAAAPQRAVAETPPAEGQRREEFGYLTLDTSPWSSVSAGGVGLGQTPIVRAKLPAGTHTLTLVNPERNLRTSYDVRIEAGKTTVRRIGLE